MLLFCCFAFLAFFSAWLMISSGALSPLPAVLLSLVIFVLLHAVYVLFFWLFSLSTPMDKPLKKQNPLCRFACRTVIPLINFYAGLRIRLTGTELLPGSRSLIYEGNILLLVHGEPDIAPLRVIARRFNLRIVVSSRFKNLYELPRIHAAAGEVMEFLLPLSRKPFAVSTGPFGTLMQLRRLAPRGDLVLPEVRALAERDAAEQSDYCLTLYTYLCCHHSLQETCAALYAHRNTVLYRVRRMKQDFGIPLDDPKKHLTLVLSSALMLLEAGEDRLFVEEMWIE